MIFNSLQKIETQIRPCDFGNVVHTFSSEANSSGASTTTWTATEDCWLYCEMEQYKYSGYYHATLSVNDNVIMTTDTDLNGVDGNYTTTGAPTIFVKKGSVIKACGECNVTAYGCIR